MTTRATTLGMRSAAVAMACAATLGASAVPAFAANGGQTFKTTLLGANEVPVLGDPDGKGTATVTINRGLRRLCYSISVSGIAPATAAHIHEAPKGMAGPVVVGLEAPTDGTSSGCITTLSRAQLKEIAKDPSDYYVNVHNAEYPGGALRGQLG
jgi:hypothetical protein